MNVFIKGTKITYVEFTINLIYFFIVFKKKLINDKKMLVIIFIDGINLYMNKKKFNCFLFNETNFNIIKIQL